MKSKFVFQAILVLSLALASCDHGGLNNLPVSTIEWVVDSDGFNQFYTNNSMHHNYTFWALYENSINGPNIYEIECKRISGNMYRSYGLIFGASDTAMDKFYFLNIFTQGFYYIGKWEGDNVTQIQDWQASGSLRTGYNRINKLKVVKAGTSYTVYINGTKVHQFTDSEIGNRIGVIAYVGDEKEEPFPNKPVDVRFRQTLSSPISARAIESRSVYEKFD